MQDTDLLQVVTSADVQAKSAGLITDVIHWDMRDCEFLDMYEAPRGGRALALSERSSGCSRLESLFLDDSFGTLDSKTPDAALNALENLRLSGRTIGVIGYINQISWRIPVGIDVKRTGIGTLTIHVKEVYYIAG